MNKQLGDAYTDLHRSVLDFHERFNDGIPPIDSAISVMYEEVLEVIMAALESSYNDGGYQRVALAKEMADVLYTVIGLGLACGVDSRMFAEAMHAVAAKNDAKTPENTHKTASGKVEENG